MDAESFEGSKISAATMLELDSLLSMLINRGLGLGCRIPGTDTQNIQTITESAEAWREARARAVRVSDMWDADNR